MPLLTTTPPTPLSDSRRRSALTARVRRHGADWLVREDWRERLLGPRAPDWFDLDDTPCAVRVKDGSGRTTWRVTVGSKTVYAKVLYDRRRVDELQGWTIGRAGEREWRALREAESRGVPVVRPLAVGVRSAPPPRVGATTLPLALRIGALLGHGTVVLVSEALTGARHLAEAWELAGRCAPPGRRPTAAGDLIEAVARLFAAAHDRGFVHGDAHPGNILVHPAEGGEMKAVFLDAHCARLSRRPVPLQRSLRCLAQLDQYFHRRATRTQRLRFLRSYAAARPLIGELYGRDQSRRSMLAVLRRVSASHARRLARTRDRRVWRIGRYFSTISPGPGWRATVVLRLERRHVFPEADVPDRCESDWRAALTELVAAVGDADGVFSHLGFQVELSRVRGVLARVLATLRAAPHRRRFERCHRRRHRDIHDELILAYLEHRSGGLVDATLLIRPDRRNRRRSSD